MQRPARGKFGLPTASWIAGYRLLDVGDNDDYTVTLTA